MEDNDQALGVAYESPSVEVVSADVIESSVAILLSGGGGGGGGTGGGGTVTPAVGTVGNPLILTKNESKTVSVGSTGYWLKFTIQGSASLNVICASGVTVKICKSAGGSAIQEKSGIENDNFAIPSNGAGTHYAFLRAPSTRSVSVIVSQYQDSVQNESGGTWTAFDGSGYEYSYDRILRMTFFPSSAISTLYTMIEDSAYLEILDQITGIEADLIGIAGGITEAMEAGNALDYVTKEVLKAQNEWIVKTFRDMALDAVLPELSLFPYSLKRYAKIALRNVSECGDGGYNALYGVVFVEEKLSARVDYSLRRWVNGNVSGPLGSIGKVSCNAEFNPAWFS